jgi:hypothetical protein
LAAAAAVEQSGEPLTVVALRGGGLSRKALARVMVAEFPSAAVAPEALGIGSSGVNKHAEPAAAPDPARDVGSGSP